MSLSVSEGVMEKLYEYYTHFVSTENIGRNFTIPAAHSQVYSKVDELTDNTPCVVHR